MRNFSDGKAEVYSAGIEVHGVNPRAIATMKDDGIDISAQTSNHIDEYNHIRFDYIITVCDNAKENCPYFPGSAKRFHQNFSDPAKAKGTSTEITAKFAEVRNQIKAFCRDFADNI